MRTIYLCGHTGSENRGCEAIVRATTDILRQLGQEEICLMSFAPEQDSALNVEVLPYPRKTMPQRAASLFMRKLLGNGVYGQRFLHRELLTRVISGDMLFNIGGDTYCYGTPYISYALNEQAEKAGIPTVFWGCSVDERVLTDRTMQRDLNRYSYIVARERLSYERLRVCVEDPAKVYLACDPAFLLQPEETALPAGFFPRNTVGINLSPLVLEGGRVEENIRYLINHILAQTDMNVCLVPHVGVQDIPVLRKIFTDYRENARVCMVEERLNCCQLKYIISRCRFFIGARTHAVIGAYSSYVPALALSYSDKSVAIARDVLGRDALAMRWQDLEQPERLWERFSQVLMAEEQEILQRYGAVLPGYREQIYQVVEKILR